jgi:aryl-alcohol dehydrogenase-like predicted oxidoreductase
MNTVRGLQLTPFGLGTAALVLPYGAPAAEREPPDRAAAVAAIEAALEAGIAFIDTAPAYDGAEALVGEVTAGAPCLIATKLGPGPVRASVEASLTALRRDRIDLLQIHNATPARLATDVVDAMAQLRAEGLVHALGATVYGEEAALAVIAEPRLDAVQVAYSALDRRPERAVLPAAAAAGTAVIGRSALLRGVLSAAGRALHGEFRELGAAADDLRHAAGVEWDELAGVAVAFAAAQPGIASVLLGPRDAAELRQLLAGGPLPPPGWHADLDAALLDPSLWPTL